MIRDFANSTTIERVMTLGAGLLLVGWLSLLGAAALHGLVPFLLTSGISMMGLGAILFLGGIAACMDEDELARLRDQVQDLEADRDDLMVALEDIAFARGAPYGPDGEKVTPDRVGIWAMDHAREALEARRQGDDQ